MGEKHPNVYKESLSSVVLLALMFLAVSSCLRQGTGGLDETKSPPGCPLLTALLAGGSVETQPGRAWSMPMWLWPR